MMYGLFECKFCDMLHIVVSHSLGKDRCILNTVFVLVGVACGLVYVCMCRASRATFWLWFDVMSKYVYIEDFVSK